jgi:cytochrome c-type biogenesis protein CcsB
MKKISAFLFSGTFMGMLLVVFAISIGYATFIENDFSADAARVMVYSTKWFELIILFMAVNFAGMIFTKKLYRKSKLNVMMIHVAWVVIIIGAGLTRYFGFEGRMHIRNGETTNKIFTADTYIRTIVQASGESLDINDRVLLAPLNKVLYKKRVGFAEKDITIKINRFIPNASMVIKNDPNGSPIMEMVTAGPDGRQDLIIRDKETAESNGLKFSLSDTAGTDAIQFVYSANGLEVRSPLPWLEVNMNSGDSTQLAAGDFVPARGMQIYSAQGTMFVIRNASPRALIIYQPSKSEANNLSENIVEANIKVGPEVRNLALKWQKEEKLTVNGVNFTISAGPQVWTVPFSLKLEKFELERYPGSQSPSSYASNVVLIDEAKQVTKPYRIFMNNILNYRGYRFYQSSYDQDEKGTVLSVNHDRWGTWVSYTGYFLLFVTLIFSFFTRNTRFEKLTGMIRDIHSKRKKLSLAVVIILISSLTLPRAYGQADTLIPVVVDKKHAAKFGKLLTQTRDGRISPINTTANNILVKVFKKNKYRGQSADQVFLGMTIFPGEWKKVPIIKLGGNFPGEEFGIRGTTYAAYDDFFEADGSYKLKARVDGAYQKSPATRSTEDKEIIALDERINVCNMAFTGALLKLYPVPDHPHSKWAGLFEMTTELQNMDSSFRYVRFLGYIGALRNGAQVNNYEQPDKILTMLNFLQRKYGNEVAPSLTKVNLEVFYNQLNIFKRLFPVYMTLGIILMGVFFIELFKPSFDIRRTVRLFFSVYLVLFIMHSLGLVLRWYIAEHAPWSNGYESMIYIAWAIVLAGILFRKTSLITLALTAILAGITLLTAHMSWLNPEITNLVPVLKSYWLTFHVATITASYGFLALGSMLGFINLALMTFRTKSNLSRVELTIEEINCVIELALSAGLILLTIGTFLGGIWANESWGRYWGWDPKETWSLVTIIVYSFILHMNLIPSFKTRFSLNFLSMIGFGSVLMTYFGVNYYLSGLHSYAEGDPVGLPALVYYILAAIVVVSITALISERRYPGLTETGEAAAEAR